MVARRRVAGVAADFRAVAGFRGVAAFAARLVAGVALDAGFADEVAAFGAVVPFAALVAEVVRLVAVDVGLRAVVVRRVVVARVVAGGATVWPLTGVIAPAAWSAAEPTPFAAADPAPFAAEPAPLATAPAAFAAELAVRAAAPTPFAATIPAPFATDPASLAAVAAADAVNRATFAARAATSFAASAACRWRFPTCLRAFCADASWRSRFDSVACAAARRFSSLRSSLVSLCDLAIGSTSVPAARGAFPTAKWAGRSRQTVARHQACHVRAWVRAGLHQPSLSAGPRAPVNNRKRAIKGPLIAARDAFLATTADTLAHDPERATDSGHQEEHRVLLTTHRRAGALAVLATIVFAACSSGGASTAPSTAATTVPTTAASAPGASGPAASTSAAPSTAAGPTPPAGNVTLQGAGATFPAPLYMSWFQTYNEKYSNIQIDYQANGSGAGITAITQQTVDFGASDAPMKDTEMASLPAGKKLFHFPTALGAVVVIYNLADVPKLQLDSATISGIYLGKITKWNDPAIAATNAGVTLPDAAIAVVHRSDGSGTTNAFTTYLDTVDPTWHAGPGAGKSVNWPVGIGASGNDGVSTAVKQTQGAVGYVDLSVAISSKLTSAYVKNADGQFVPGSTDGVTAAAEAAVSTFPADFRQTPIINGAGATTYPIATYTYLLVYADQADATKGQALVSFLYWALTDGQAAETALGYAPLPPEVDQKALTQLHLVSAGGAPIWP